MTVLTIMASFLHAIPAHAEGEAIPADRARVVSAWRFGGAQVQGAAEAALIGSDAQVQEFLEAGWQQAQRLDERETLVNAINEGGPSVRAAAQRALDAADAGDQNAITIFLNEEWKTSANVDARLSVNQFMATGGPQVKEAAQQALDSDDPAVWQEFVDSGWQVQWQTDQRLRVNQAMATGGPNVKAAGQKALDADTPEALEAFLEYGWAVAAAQDEETETLTNLLEQAQAAGEMAEQETQNAKQEADRAAEASEAARKSAAEAAQATADAGDNTAQAAAAAKRAAVAAQKAAQAAKVAVQSAAAAHRAARAAATAAARAASAAARAGQEASKAYKAAANAATDASKADEARQAAEFCNKIADMADQFAIKANQAGQAVQHANNATTSADSAAKRAMEAAAANDLAIKYAKDAGANTGDAVAASASARANADRAIRAAQAAHNYLIVAMNAAFDARDSAMKAAANARTAALKAIEAADHAGDAAQAATRATEAATAATVASQAAVVAAEQAAGVYEAARAADAERLAVARDQALESAQTANTIYDAQQRATKWDAEQAVKRDAETTQLIAEAQNPATDPAAAVVASRKVALALAKAPGAWTSEAAISALKGADDEVLAFVRTDLAKVAALDDRQTLMDLAVTDDAALRDAALKALEGSDAEVSQFLRNPTYPGRYSGDRIKVNQIMAKARKAGDTVLMQKAQQALDADNPQTLRDFLEDGQYSAAEIGQRVLVNQILASADSGPELKAAAQVALDGPPTGLREFLDVGRYAAAERDHDAAVHLTVVGGLLEKINETAEIAVQNALEAQAVAAKARDDATAAASYANQALQSAKKAADYAAKAASYFEQAVDSAEKAEASVATAKSAAIRADNSARSAIRSAAWAITSQQKAIKAASEANAAAEEAKQSALEAGADRDAAIKAAQEARATWAAAAYVEGQRCNITYARDPIANLERQLGDPTGDYYKTCIANVIADPDELADRAYVNAGFCANLYPNKGRLYQNCLHSVLDPEFRGVQPLILLSELLKGMAAPLLPLGVMAGVGCVLTVVCGAVAGILLTIGEVSFEVYKLTKGDQTLSDTLLHLGQTAIESLVFAGVAKLVTAGFRSIRALHLANNNAKKAAAALEAARISQASLPGGVPCVGHSFAAQTPVVMADGSRRPISEITVGDSVIATDPLSGRTSSQQVGRVWRHHDDDLTDVQIADPAGRTTTLHTTPSHLFWSESTRSWVEAAGLAPGDRLSGLPQGTPVTVASVEPRPGEEVMYDLSVDEIHSYYVAVDDLPVLVHNNDCGKPITYISDDLSTAAFNARVNSGSSRFPAFRNTEWPGGNVAVAEVEGYDKLIIGFSQGSGYHSEDHIIDQINELRKTNPGIGKINRLYSERQICSVCQTKLPPYLADDVALTYSVPWPDNQTMRKASDELLAMFIRLAAGGRA